MVVLENSQQQWEDKVFIRCCRRIESGEDARDTDTPVDFRNYSRRACRKMVEGEELVGYGQPRCGDYELAVHIHEGVDMFGIYIQGQRGIC